MHVYVNKSVFSSLHGGRSRKKIYHGLIIRMAAKRPRQFCIHLLIPITAGMVESRATHLGHHRRFHVVFEAPAGGDADRPTEGGSNHYWGITGGRLLFMCVHTLNLLINGENKTNDLSIAVINALIMNFM